VEITAADTLLDLIGGAQIVSADRQPDGLSLFLADGRIFLIVGEFDLAIYTAKERLH
jgi:dsDNA-binding SOS-regulon protein